MSEVEQVFWFGVAIGTAFGWVVAKANWRGVFENPTEEEDAW
jgi:hypothetical protein